MSAKSVKKQNNKSVKEETPQFTSITKMCYYYFDKMGFGDSKVLYEKLLEEAKKIKPDTKFKKTHVAFHKKNWLDAKKQNS